jgi:hypothetical protein
MPNITNQELENDMLRVKKLIKRIPSCQDYHQHGKFHGSTYARRFGSWNNALKQILGEIVSESPLPRPIHKCQECELKTKNPKFCSRKCATSYNNRITKRKYEPNLCPECNKEIQRSSIVCSNCQFTYNTKKYGDSHTLGEFKKIKASKNRYQGIRNHAHRVAKINNMDNTKCHCCEYKNHVDLCHIKDICSFSDETTLTEINDPKNLIFLCPNHHWDLGHGLLNI